MFKKTILYATLYVITAGIFASTFFLPHYEGNDYPWLRGFIILFATTLLVKYCIYMAASPWYDVIQRLHKSVLRRYREVMVPYAPRVSIIIPAWNEEVGILNTVRSVLSSEYRNMEVIVVNDGSTDDSDAIMRDFLNDYYDKKVASTEPLIPVVYRYRENSGKGSALNRGIALSSGEVIVSIDADCVLRPDTISKFVECFEDPRVMAAVGNVKIWNTDSILGTLQYLEFLFAFYFKKADSIFNTVYIIGGAAGAFRREVFERIGGYSEENITEDIDLSVRIQDAGMRIAYASSAIVYTEGANTLDGLFKQRLRWKRGRFQTFSEHRHLFFSARKHHNKLLTWLVLPFAVFGDIQLFFEILFLALLYLYSFLTNDFSSFISGIIVVCSMFMVQLFDDPSKRRLSLIFLAPIGWLLFYITTIVEYHALLKSLWGMLTRKKIRWQRWERKGLFVQPTFNR